ncbi:phosphoserine phosphatase SerB [Ponticaulis sp.]|uniref:phosphoserine phosphatase SerB n=1 Tax=Ponticaulis sp. TaxID=2020902 RepID=UPI0025F6D372|nr:phosphoserine phosphatase SerB [Ponticaulis sp.]|tara:strand:+ start:3674 stop:4585 length:912 start_codon:yes stop_codon:yes gene_type:complete
MSTTSSAASADASVLFAVVIVSHDGERHAAPERLQSASIRILGPGAMEFRLPLSEDEAEALSGELEAELGAGFDVFIGPDEGRAKKLLICDMDSTVIGQECIDELADYAGIKSEISKITERAMRGELDFEAALTERVGLLKGLSVSALQQCFDERITLNPGVKTLTATMKARGGKCLLVSGGFTYFTSRVAKAAGFDENYANTLEMDEKALTGEVGRPILGRQAKLDRLNEAVAAMGITDADVISMGDGANDMAMIEAAGMGVGYHPHPVLAEAANAVIKGPSLATALYFQGIPKSEWVVVED